MTDYIERAFNFSKQGVVLYGEDSDFFKPIKVSDINPFYKRSSLETSYGEMSVAQNYPSLQVEPVYGIFPESFQSLAFSGATAAIYEREFELQTNTTSGAYAEIVSKKSLNYKAGYGNVARFAARFPSGGVENSNQFVGLTNTESEIGFGFSGESFGIWYQYSGSSEIRRLNLTSAATGPETANLNINGESFSIPITGLTTQVNAYEISRFLTTGASDFYSWQNTNNIYVAYEIDGPKTDTYSYSSAGSSSGSWSVISSGAYKVGQFIPQTSWNIDTRTGSVFSERNLYQINYQNISYGGIKFSIENSETAEFEPVHIIKNSNGNSLNNPIANPYLHLGMYSESLGSTENIKTYCSSFSAFTQGQILITKSTNSISNTKTVGTTLTNLFTIRNKRMINSILNHSEIQPLIITSFTEANKGVIIKLILNASVSGIRNFNNVNSALISEYDIVGSSVSESVGTELLTLIVPPNSSQVLCLEPLNLRILENSTLTVAAKLIGTSASDTSASLVWYEDI